MANETEFKFGDYAIIEQKRQPDSGTDRCEAGHLATNRES